MFEGRFFIALALALGRSEPAVTIDTFDWPDEGIWDRFMANVRRFLPHAEVVGRRRGASEGLTADLRRSDGQRPRMLHVDADHTVKS
ncbi:hypothetical protein [Sphingomonas bacterium]|uniref:hypothetical protein n=1 Tax=Sphingomonas bacterium TaxID=1895847 RepID=UPI0034A034CE